MYYISLLPGSPTLHNHLMVIDHCLWFCYNFLSAPQSWHLILNSDITPPAEKSVSFGGVKPKKICKQNCGSIMSTKNKFCIKTAISALSSGPSNLQKPIWARHHQQDDQYRNTNIKNKIMPSGCHNLRLVLISKFSQNFVLETRMLCFSRHSRQKCRKSRFLEQNSCY